MEELAKCSGKQRQRRQNGLRATSGFSAHQNPVLRGSALREKIQIGKSSSSLHPSAPPTKKAGRRLEDSSRISKSAMSKHDGVTLLQAEPAARSTALGHTSASSKSKQMPAGKVEEAVARLGATAQSYGHVYNACSHTYLMVRDSATQELVGSDLDLPPCLRVKNLSSSCHPS